MDEYFVRDFWKRIDDLRGKMTIQELSEKSGIKYHRIKDNRSDMRVLSLEDACRIADVLHTSVDYLCGRSTAFSDESQFVESTPDAKKLIQTFMKNEEILKSIRTLMNFSVEE